MVALYCVLSFAAGCFATRLLVMRADFRRRPNGGFGRLTASSTVSLGDGGLFVGLSTPVDFSSSIAPGTASGASVMLLPLAPPNSGTGHGSSTAATAGRGGNGAPPLSAGSADDCFPPDAA